MKRSLALAALCSTALVATVALAATSIVKSGTPAKIGVSGEGGRETSSLSAGNPIMKLRFAENGADTPNFVGVTAFDDSWNKASFEEKAWGSSDASMKTLELAFNADTKRAFHGLQVCLNAAKTRVKGVRAFASEFVWEGNIAKPQKRAALKEEFVRPNCDEKNGWMPARHCPDGQVMVGVSIEFNKNPWPEMTGLAPICQAVTLRRVTTN